MNDGSPPPEIVIALNAYIQRLHDLFSPLGFEPNIVLVHPQTGLSLSAGVSSPDALLASILKTRDAPDTFTGKATIDGEMTIEETSATGETIQ